MSPPGWLYMDSSGRAKSWGNVLPKRATKIFNRLFPPICLVPIRSSNAAPWCFNEMRFLGFLFFSHNVRGIWRVPGACCLPVHCAMLLSLPECHRALPGELMLAFVGIPAKGEPDHYIPLSPSKSHSSCRQWMQYTTYLTAGVDKLHLWIKPARPGPNPARPACLLSMTAFIIQRQSPAAETQIVWPVRLYGPS